MIHGRRVSLLLPGVNGLRMLGVVHEAVVFLLEQLYGSRHCRSYRFRFHKPEETDEPPINPHGSARAEINHRLGRDLHTHICSTHLFGTNLPQTSLFWILCVCVSDFHLPSVCFPGDLYLTCSISWPQNIASLLSTGHKKMMMRKGSSGLPGRQSAHKIPVTY